MIATVAASLAALIGAWQAGLPAKYQVPRPAPEKALAKVNGVEIKAAEVESLLWEWRKSEVLDELITYRLLKTEADKLGVTVADSDVDLQVKAALDQLKQSIGPNADLATALAEQGSAPSRVFLRLRNKLLLDGITIRTFQPTGYVKVATMVFRPATEQVVGLQEAFNRADKAADRLAKGESWDFVLKDTTTDAEMIKRQGIIGWRMITAFPESLQAQLKGAKAGWISKPIRTQAGVQIFRVEAQGAGAAASDLDSLKSQFLESERGNTLSRLHSAAKVERFDH